MLRYGEAFSFDWVLKVVPDLALYFCLCPFLSQGEKVLDDPKLLRRSLKRKEKAKQKSRKQWYVGVCILRWTILSIATSFS